MEDFVKQDAQIGLGNTLQTQVMQYAAAWNALPPNEKAVAGRRTAIEQALDDANEIYQQVGMAAITYEQYMSGGGSLPHIPTTRPTGLALTDTEYTVMKTRHANALKKANTQRAAAKGDYIHTEVERYAAVPGRGYQYSDPGIDLLHTSSGLRFEVMVAGAWSDHSGPTFQQTFWRALQY